MIIRPGIQETVSRDVLREQRAGRGRLRTHPATAATTSDSECVSNEPDADACVRTRRLPRQRAHWQKKGGKQNGC